MTGLNSSQNIHRVKMVKYILLKSLVLSQNFNL